MKIPTIFLAAVAMITTLFQESPATPVASMATGMKALVDIAAKAGSYAGEKSINVAQGLDKAAAWSRDKANSQIQKSAEFAVAAKDKADEFKNWSKDIGEDALKYAQDKADRDIQTVKSFYNDAKQAAVEEIDDYIKTNKQDNTKDLINYTNEKILSSNNDLAIVKETSEKAKESINKLCEWLDYFVPVVDDIHNKIRDAVQVDSKTNTADVVDEMNAAKEKTNAKVDEFKEINYNINKITKHIKNIVKNAEDVAVKMTN